MNNYAIMHARDEESYWYWKGLDPHLTEAQRVAIPENYRLAKEALAEIAYPTIEPDEDSDGGDYDPEDKSAPLQRQPWFLTPKGERECLLGTLERLSVEGRRELEK